MVPRFYLPVFSCFLSLPLSLALLNVTVDSSDDVIQYSPPSSWSANGSENTTAIPDVGLASNGTWQFASINANDDIIGNVTLSTRFSGTAVYVFAILQKETLTAINFLLNGTQVGSYNHAPDTIAAYVYNRTVYANASLPPGEHALSVSLSQADSSVFFFDSIVYSSEEQSISGNGTFAQDPSSTLVETPALNAPALSLEPSPSSTSFVMAPLTIEESPPSLSSQPSESPSTASTASLEPVTGTVAHITVTGDVGSPSQASETSVPPRVSSSATSSKSNVVIIAAVAGSLGILLILILLVFCYVRYKSGKKFYVEPYISPDSTPSISPNEQDIFTKLPESASSTRPFIKRLSFQTMAESTATGVTLTDEIFPLPSEMEDVYSQLEALSMEVQKFRATESFTEDERWSQWRSRPVSQDVKSSIDQLRSEIQRLRRRSGVSSTNDGRTVDTNLLNMIRELDLLRAELHEAVGQSDNDSSIERLPSYHSRKNVCVNTSHETPPPLPSAYMEKGGVRTRA